MALVRGGHQWEAQLRQRGCRIAGEPAADLGSQPGHERDPGPAASDRVGHPVGVPAGVRHPLDLTTAEEFELGREILVRAGRVGEHTRFPNVMPVDPDKDVVAAFADGDPVERRLGYTLLELDTGQAAEDAAASAGIRLEVVRLPGAKRGFVLLPRRWVVERSFAWLARFRRLARDYERLASTLKGMHLAAFAIVMLARLMNWEESA